MRSPSKRGRGRRLKGFVAGLRSGEVMAHRNLTLLPLFGGACRQIEYDLSNEAIGAGALRITELDETGSVRELLAINDGDRMALLLEGEELVGAKQDRVLNTSVLLRPRSRTRIPVSCVEEGRWQRRSTEFGSGSYSPPSLRRLKSMDVTRLLRTHGTAASDQRVVWSSVGHYLRTYRTSSRTHALGDVIQQNRELLEAYAEALLCPQEACGVLMAINGRFAVADVFDKPATLARTWPRLITGCALDALAWQEGRQGALGPGLAAALLEHVGKIECETHRSAGMGEDWRFEAEGVVGQALVVEGTCVHLTVFPDPGASERRPERRAGIGPPPGWRRGPRPGADRGQ